MLDFYFSFYTIYLVLIIFLFHLFPMKYFRAVSEIGIVQWPKVEVQNC